MKRLLFSFLALSSVLMTNAQSLSDANTPVTWLGLDFTQVKFIGSATQWKDAGEITNSELRDKYFPAWNDLFVNEKDRYKVADAVNRTEVDYAIDITEKANNAIKNGFFEEDGNLYQTITEEKVTALVKKYDFKGRKGIGLMFFVEGMSKGKEEASMWATFVDMGSKKVLLTKRVEGKAGGFGFRNYWAKSFNNGLKEIKSNWKTWSKS
jgi:hypothetical protein